MKQITFILLQFIIVNSIAQNIVDLDVSSCDMDSQPEYIYKNRLISKSIINDTLNLHIGVVQNCDFNPKIGLFMNEDSLIVQIENTSEFWAACECCYELVINATGIKDTNFVLMREYKVINSDENNEGKKIKKYAEIKHYRNKFIFPTLSEIMDSVSKNRYQNDSLKVGYWSSYYEGTKKLKTKVFYFINSQGESQTNWYAIFDKNQKLTEVCKIIGADSKGISHSFCLTGNQYRRYILNEE